MPDVQNLLERVQIGGSGTEHVGHQRSTTEEKPQTVPPTPNPQKAQDGHIAV